MTLARGEFPDAETLAVCERFSHWLRQGGGLPIRGRPLAGGQAAGLDFEGHREYRPGHDLRHLDWALYARLRSLYVRTFEDEGAGTLAVFVDTSASMGHGEPPKLDLARRFAAALAYAGLRECHGVLLGAASDGRLSSLTLTGGLAALEPGLQFLRGLEARGQTRLAAAFAGVPRLRTGGDAVLITDLFDPAGLEGTLDTLRRAGWQPDIVRMTHADEWIAPRAGAGVRDPETGVAATAPKDTAALEARLEGWRATTRAQALRRGCAVVEIDACTSLARALTTFFDTVFAVRGHV